MRRGAGGGYGGAGGPGATARRPAEEEEGGPGRRAGSARGEPKVSPLTTRRPLAVNGRSGRVILGAGGLLGVLCMLPAPTSVPAPAAWAPWREWALLAWGVSSCWFLESREVFYPPREADFQALPAPARPRVGSAGSPLHQPRPGSPPPGAAGSPPHPGAGAGARGDARGEALPEHRLHRKSLKTASCSLH